MFAWVGVAWNWVANSKPAQIALMVIGAILALKTVQMKARMDGEKAERDRQEKAQAKIREKMVERATTIIKEERTNADAALAARDSVEHVPDYDSLPDDFKAIAQGRARVRGQDGG